MLRIRLMTAGDLLQGLRLSQQAGWNQTATDWLRFLNLQPDGCFVAEWDHTLVGTTVTTLFDSVAWIAMVLVEKSMRQRGIGLALLTHALDYLDRRLIATIRLDATALGQPLYQRLGFEEQFALARYEGALPPAPASRGVEEAPQEEWEKLAALDEMVTGTDRRNLLFRLFAEQPRTLYVRGDKHRAAGFLASRPGTLAVHLGPCMAVPEAGPLLFAEAWHRWAGQRVFLDVPVANQEATRWAEAAGLTVQRSFTRMCRGVPVCERIDWLWASSGPEKG